MNEIAFIYKITNKINNMKYIGISRDRAVFSRWHEHLQAQSGIGEALTTYGIENFIFEVVEMIKNVSNEDLFRLESQYIQDNDSINNGYNKGLSSKRVSKMKEIEFTQEAEDGMYAFMDMCYIGVPSNNINNKLSFWKSLQDRNLCMATLLTNKNYMTNKNSKYYELLKIHFSGRKQRYFKIEHASEAYVIDNLNSMIDLMGLIDKPNPSLPFILGNYRVNHDNYELIIDDEDYGVQRLKVYGTLLYDDELVFIQEVKTIRDIYNGSGLEDRPREV